MYTIKEIDGYINKLLSEKFFSGMRKIIVEEQKIKLMKTTEYKKGTSDEKRELTNLNYKLWYKSVSTFFLSYKSIYALHPLVSQEMKIREFTSEEIIRIKANYNYLETNFSAHYPINFNNAMRKEIEECIRELKNNSHILDRYVYKTDTEKIPPPPLTTAQLKNSAFYLLSFELEYVTELSNKLYKAGLITNPETNGWHIEDGVVEDIINVLNHKYKHEKVLQQKRKYFDKVIDREEKECIRPTMVTMKYFPKFIKECDEFIMHFPPYSSDSKREKHNIEQEHKDLIALYEFIFYSTLATQMKNSIYDTSIIGITVGEKKLEEQANVLISGEENWEKLMGGIRKKIARNSDTFEKAIVKIPNIPMNNELIPLSIYDYKFNSKRPPRFGKGRFLIQVLEKYNIGINSEHDNIIKELVDSNAIRVIESMLHPQENSIIMIEWISKHMPLLLNLDYFRELQEKINLVVSGELTLNSIIEEISTIIDEGFKSSGYELNEEKPSDAKIRLLKSVVLKHKLSVDESVYESNIKIDMILAQYPVAIPIKIGSCPECNSIVYQKEFINEGGEVVYYFSCEKFSKEGECAFRIWDSYIYKFFSEKSLILHTIKERAKALEKILSKKRGHVFTGLLKKDKKPLEAKVYINPYEDRYSKKTKWSFSLRFLKNGK